MAIRVVIGIVNVITARRPIMHLVVLCDIVIQARHCLRIIVLAVVVVFVVCECENGGISQIGGKG